MPMRTRQTRLSQLGLAAVILLVLGVTVFHPAPVRPAPPSEADQRALFDEIVREEPAARDRALDDWAHHRWSQQDAFGAFENERINNLAGQKGLWSQDLFRVVDEGIRAGWPGPDGKPLNLATVPLKPRSMD